jgi:lysophospholipase
MDWNKRLAGAKPVSKPILVLQGTKDTIVDWKYNTALIKKIFPAAELRYFKEGDHYLFNEAEKTRSEVFEILSGYLNDGKL